MLQPPHNTSSQFIFLANLFFYPSLAIKRNEIFVASRLGVLHRVQWNGTVDTDLSLPISSIPFSLDLETPIGRWKHENNIVMVIVILNSHNLHNPLLAL